MFVLALQTEIFKTCYCCTVHLSYVCRHTIYCSSVFAKLLKKTNIFGLSVVFSRKIVQISVFKVEYLENGLADFNDSGLILQAFGRPFR